MLYLLAAVGLATAGVLLWQASAPGNLATSRTGRSSAPDDDPEFLATLDKRVDGDDL